MPVTSAPDLVLALRSCRLLDVSQLEETTRLAVRFPDARHLARELINRGWLTPYQANQILQGRGHALRLGQYLLLERLGEGGMGAVFKARQTRTGRTVALKLIRKERLSNPAAVKRFQREILAAAQLDHPNIVHVYDADEVNGIQFFAMEFVDGTDLAKIIKQRGPLSVVLACDFIRQAALGLQHAFELGMVHRDIKPHNLLVASASDQHNIPPGTLKVLDMGLARVAENPADDSRTSVTGDGTLMGTVDYIAPEQARDSHTVDIRADLYSLGCTFYYLLTGRVPYPGGVPMEKLMRHQLDPIPSPQDLRPEVPPGVAAIVMQLMAKRPEDRFQTPAELVAALDAVELGSTPPEDRVPTVVPLAPAADTADSATGTVPPGPADPIPVTAPRRPLRAARRKNGRRKLIVAGVATPLVIALLVGGVLWGLSQRPNPTAPGHGSTDPTTRPQLTAEQKRREEAERALQPLLISSADPAADRAALRVFLMQYSGTPAASKACERLGEVLTRIPSPLDQCDPKKLPRDAVDFWRLTATGVPAELVGVLGEHRRRHAGTVRALASSPDGQWIASADVKLIYLWDTTTRQVHAVLKGHASCTDLAFSPDGRRLATAGGSAVRLWNVATGKELAANTTLGSCLCVAWTPDGDQVLAGAGAETIAALDGETLKEKTRFGGFKQTPRAVAAAPGGKWAAAVGGDGVAQVWDLTAKEPAPIVLDGGSYLVGTAIAFVGDHRQVVVVQQRGKASLWKLDGDKPEETVLAPSGVCSLAIARDGRRLALGFSDKRYVVLYDRDGGGFTKGRQLTGPQTVVSPLVAFSADQPILVAAGADGVVRLWDVNTGSEIDALGGQLGAVSRLTFVADPPALLTGGNDGIIRQWSLLTFTDIRRFARHDSAVTALAVAPDGKKVASASATDKKPLVWDLDSGSGGQQLEPPFKAVTRLVFSPDGRSLLGGGTDDALRSWDVAEKRELQTFLPAGKSSARVGCYSPDGRLVLTANRDDKVLIALDGATGKEVKRVEIESGVTDLAMTPDGRQVLFAQQHLWSWSFQAAPVRLAGAAGTSDSLLSQGRLTVSPDGKMIALAAADGRVSVWEMASGRRLQQWLLPFGVGDAEWAPDGRHLAVGNSNGTVYIFRLGLGPKS